MYRGFSTTAKIEASAVAVIAAPDAASCRAHHTVPSSEPSRAAVAPPQVPLNWMDRSAAPGISAVSPVALAEVSAQVWSWHEPGTSERVKETVMLCPQEGCTHAGRTGL